MYVTEKRVLNTQQTTAHQPMDALSSWETLMELGGGDDDAPGGRDESPSSADAATTSTDLPEPAAAPPAIVAPPPQKQKIHWQPHEDALLLETVDRI